jgi:hypothetical protein
MFDGGSKGIFGEPEVYSSNSGIVGQGIQDRLDSRSRTVPSIIYDARTLQTGPTNPRELPHLQQACVLSRTPGLPQLA